MVFSGTTSRALIVVCLAALQVVCAAQARAIPDKSGTKPTVLSVPAGPGSIEGLGKGFQPQFSTGSAVYELALEVPPGPTGFSPSLTLTYNTGFGNGALGRGWRLTGPLAIERQTVKGFPHFRDTDGDGKVRDVFVFQGEELVSLSDGTYRIENDESFRRFSPVASQLGGAADSWLVEDRDGTRRWLGRHVGDAGASASRVLNPSLDSRSSFERTFRWLEDAAEDVNGNRIEYHYQAHADSPGVLYLTRVTYRAVGVTDTWHVIELLTEPRPDRLSEFRSGFERRWARRYREISVGSYFGGSLHRVRAYELSYDLQNGALPSRPAAANHIGLGISALHQVTLFGSDRGWGGSGERGTPLPSTRFAYTPMTLQPLDAGLQDRLTALTYRLPPHEPDPLAAGPFISQLTQDSPTGRVSGIFDTQVHHPRVQFADVDGDGLTDILDTRLDENPANPTPTYTVARNVGDGRFHTSRPVQHPEGLHLGQHTELNQTFLADADGDGRVDLLRIAERGTQRRTVVCKNLFDGGFRDAMGFSCADPVFDTPPGVDTTDPDGRQIDLNFDKIPDFLVSSNRRLTGYVAASDGTWTPLASVPTDRVLRRRYRFSIGLPDGRRVRNPLVQLADMNGDRLLDLVRILIRNPGEAEVRYRPMTGPMTWGPEATFHFAQLDGSSSRIPASLALPGIRLGHFDPNNRWSAVRIMDTNGDGLSDIVFVEPDGVVRVYFNAHGAAVAGPYSVAGISRYQPNDRNNPTLLRTTDINGNGSVDVLVYHRSGGPGVQQGIWYLDFVGGQKPGLLQIVDNGIGLRSYIRYKPAVVDQIAAEQAGKPWTNVSPVPMWVVSGIVDDIGLDFNRDGESDRYATTFRYRDPHYDGFEKQFRGFRFVQQIEWGDDIDPATGLPMLEPPIAGHRTMVTRYQFHTGAPDGVDNDDYRDGFDTEARAPAQVIDEKTTLGGREEEALKGKLLLQESIHPLALLDPAADFDACARTLILEPGRSAENDGCTPDRYVHRREEHIWKVRRLYRPFGAVAPKGRLFREEPNTFALREMTVSFPYRAELVTTVPEANGVLRDTFRHPEALVAAADPVTLKVDFDYDNFGNIVLERNWGVTSGLDPPVDDERVVRSAFVLHRSPEDGTVTPWILNRLANRRVEDEHGNFVSEDRYFYDGAPFVGLALGQLDRRGLLSRLESRVSDRSVDSPPLSWLPSDTADPLPGPGDPRTAVPEWIVRSRASYDEVGNKIAAADGLARLTDDGRPDPETGHVTLTTFDPVFRTFPVEERLRVGGGNPDLVFRAAYVNPETEYAAAMNWGHGVMTRIWDANGHRTDYLYDQHGRLTAIRSPGDSDAFPTVIHSYRLADPHRGVRYNYDRLGRLQPDRSAVPVTVDQAANLVITDRRETAGQDGVFRRAAFSTGRGAEVLRLEEDSSNGYAVLYAARLGLRGTVVFEAQPYRQEALDFQVPGTEFSGSDLSRDPMGRVVRRGLPPEADLLQSPRLETRVNYLPLSEWRFDEEDLASVDPSQDHRGTPLVLNSDGLQRLVAATEHAKVGDVVSARPTSYVYDLNDKLAGILDSQGNLRVMRNDGLGRRIALHDVNRGLLRIFFDAADNVTETVDAKGQRITYHFDGVNRMLSEEYHDAGESFSSGRQRDPRQPVSKRDRPDVLYMYDEPAGLIDLDNGESVRASNTRGFLASVSDLSGEEHISYDSRGRIAWQVKRIAPVRGGSPAASYRTVLTHDSSDRLIGIEYPDGTHIAYTHDRRNRTKRIDSPQLGVIVADQTYTAAGLRAGILFGNGVLTSIAYDPRLRPMAVATRPPKEGTPLFLDYLYRYDGASNMLAIEDKRPARIRAQRFGNSQQFIYDDLYRLTGASYDTGRLSLAYDSIGNMTERRFTAVAGVPARVFSPGHIRHGGMAGVGNRIGRPGPSPGPHAPSKDQTGRKYSYDANGNLTELGDTTFTWDFKDRLVVAETPTERVEYIYDYTGRRITKQIIKSSLKQGGSTGETHYASKYFEVAGGKAQRYVFDGATRLARMTQDGDLNFYHHDLVGSTDALSDALGALVQSSAFLPFGAIRTQYTLGEPVDAAAPDYLFAQKERDRETGLLYFEARYLNPSLGRFTRVDPAIIALPSEALETPQLLNGYAFAANNSLKYGDSSGQWIETVWDAYSLSTSISDAINDPSFLNIAYVVADTAAVVLPGVPSIGAAMKAGKGAANAVKGLDKATDAAKGAKNAPDFVVTPKGEAIPVPTGAKGPFSTRKSGIQYGGGSGGKGLDPKVTGVRVMDANKSQGSRAVYMNRQGQTVNPKTGRTVPKKDPSAHHYLKP